jgi:hypothetical protein
MSPSLHSRTQICIIVISNTDCGAITVSNTATREAFASSTNTICRHLLQSSNPSLDHCIDCCDLQIEYLIQRLMKDYLLESPREI